MGYTTNRYAVFFDAIIIGDIRVAKLELQMEIEAKFILSDVVKFQSLQAIDQIGDFALSAHQIQQVRDTYLDTKERLVLASGYSCRLRKTETDVLITIKGLEKSTGAIHRRKELEVSLPVYDIPQNWAKSPARNLILQLIGEEPLTPLFDFQQTRVFRRVLQGKREVAQLSLDNVHIVSGSRKQRHFELEVELRPEGTQNDLTEIVTFLQNKKELEPESQSKFERSLRFMNEDSPEGELLTPQENAICAQIAKGDDLYALRAQGLLMLDKGKTQDEVAQHVQRTIGTIRRWLMGFQKKRLGDFPKRILSETLPAPAVILPEMPVEKKPPRKKKKKVEEKPEVKTQPLQELLERYLVDHDHARTIADHALMLFDKLDDFHNLTPKDRPLLKKAAFLHNIGLASGAKGHHKKGRDILLKNPPEELNSEERLMVTLTTYLNRKKMTYKTLEKKKSKKVFANLSDKAQNEAITLSALIRLADGLDYSQSQSSKIDQVTENNGKVELIITGPNATEDAARAQKKSDLWHLLFKTKLRFSAEEVAFDHISSLEEDKATHNAPPRELPTLPNIKADDSMGEAARKIFAYQFQRILYFEESIRKDDDIENLHKMRVSTRRIRAAFRVFSEDINRKEFKMLYKGMQRTGRKLGNMRDLDVFWEKTQHYLDTFSPERQNDLDPLRIVWEEERNIAREALMTYLDGDIYTQLKANFAKSLQKDALWQETTISESGSAKPHRVRHIVPAIIYKQVAGVLAYDEWVTNPNVSLKELHQLRIASKCLRYTLEFFKEVLSPQTETAIIEIRKLQDHLGDLQDAVVASEFLRNFLTWGKWGQPKEKKNNLPKEPILAPGVATYLADRQGELYRQLRTFPEVWAYFQSDEFKKLMAEVIITL